MNIFPPTALKRIVFSKRRFESCKKLLTLHVVDKSREGTRSEISPAGRPVDNDAAQRRGLEGAREAVERTMREHGSSSRRYIPNSIRRVGFRLVNNPISQGVRKAGGKLAKTPMADRMLNSNSFIYTLLRSTVSSQASSWTDMGMSFVLFAWASLSPWLSTALGALAGGIVNCLTTYRFTFHAQGCPWRAVVVKFAIVWLGSLLLNAFGTQTAFYLLQKWDWLATVGFREDGYFAAARLGVSLLVSLGWNFLLQRYFVYRNNSFDNYAIRFMNIILPVHRRRTQA